MRGCAQFGKDRRMKQLKQTANTAYDNCHIPSVETFLRKPKPLPQNAVAMLFRATLSQRDPINRPPNVSRVLSGSCVKLLTENKTSVWNTTLPRFTWALWLCLVPNFESKWIVLPCALVQMSQTYRPPTNKVYLHISQTYTHFLRHKLIKYNIEVRPLK